MFLTQKTRIRQEMLSQVLRHNRRSGVFGLSAKVAEGFVVSERPFDRQFGLSGSSGLLSALVLPPPYSF